MTTRRTFITAGAALAGATALGVTSATVGPAPSRASAAEARTVPPLGFSAGSSILWESPAAMAQTLDAAVAVGATIIRFDIPWHFAQPTATTWNWGFIDAVVNAAVARGLSILGVIGGTPSWAALDNSTLITTRPASTSTYAAFAAAVAKRYLGKISAYEIWNEPNARMYFSPDPDPEFYTQMVKAAYPAIKKVAPNVPVLAGSFGPTIDSPADGLMHAVTFLTRAYAAGLSGYFDHLSYHPYEFDISFADASRWDNSPMRQMVAIHELMERYGDGDKKIWLTEYGAPTSVVSEEVQSSVISASLLQWPEVSYCGPVYLYTVHDSDSSSSDSEARYGAFTSSYTPKPLAYAVQSLQGAKMPERHESVVFGQHVDAALGSSVTPIRPQGGGYAQEFENGTRFLTNNGFFSSPPEVATLARQHQIVPVAAFGADRQDFDVEGGLRIFSRPATTGTHVVAGVYLSHWTESLGFPTTDEYQVDATTRAIDFENGRVSWTANLGSWVTTA